MPMVPQADLDGSPPLDDPLSPPPAPAAAATSEPGPGAPRPRPGASPAGAPPGSPPPAAGAPGLREQIGSTRSAGQRLIGAHVELAKAEIADVADAAKRAAVF